MILHPTLCCSHLQRWPPDVYIKAHYISNSLARPLLLRKASPSMEFCTDHLNILTTVVAALHVSMISRMAIAIEFMFSPLVPHPSPLLIPLLSSQSNHLINDLGPPVLQSHSSVTKRIAYSALCSPQSAPPDRSRLEPVDRISYLHHPNQ